MKTSFSLKVLKFALKLKGVKKIWAQSPLDIKALRKDDLSNPPLALLKRNAGSSFKLMDSKITELGNPNSKFISIYFPGGAFVSGPKDYNYAFAENLVKNCPTKVWLVDYPKAPEHKIDQIAVNADKIFEKALSKTDANKIVLIGDSAGGNIIMTLTQRLISQKKELPLCLIPITPVFDASMTNLSINTWNEKDFILDLFCGIGNFSLPVAALGAKVKGVELDEAMVARAKQNARLNRIKNCSFECLNLQTASDIKSLDISRVNKILLDPPRSGCNEVLSEMNLKSVKKVVYVSCNPITFARDAAVLNRLHHFELKEVGVLNMFPHTAHFECVGSFER